MGQAAPTSSSELFDNCPCLHKLRNLFLFNHRDAGGFSLDYDPPTRSQCCSAVCARPELYLSTHDLFWFMLNSSPNTMSFSSRKCVRVPMRLPHALRNMKRSIVKVDLCRIRVHDEEVIEIIDLCSTTLLELNLYNCCYLTQRTWSTIPKCTKLKRLSIGDEYFSDHQMKEIILATDLEKLVLYNCPTIRAAGLLNIRRRGHLLTSLPYRIS